MARPLINSFGKFLENIARNPASSQVLMHRSLPSSHNARITGPASVIIPGQSGGIWKGSTQDNFSLISFLDSSTQASPTNYHSSSKLAHDVAPFLPIWQIILADNYLLKGKDIGCIETYFSNNTPIGIIVNNESRYDLAQDFMSQHQTSNFFSNFFYRDEKSGDLFLMDLRSGEKELINWPESVITSGSDEKILEEKFTQEYQDKLQELNPNKTDFENVCFMLSMEPKDKIKEKYHCILRPFMELVANHFEENPRPNTNPKTSNSMSLSNEFSPTLNDDTDPYSRGNW